MAIRAPRPMSFSRSASFFPVCCLDPVQLESLEKRLKASHEAKSRLAKEKKAIAAKATRTEGENTRVGAEREILGGRRRRGGRQNDK